MKLAFRDTLQEGCTGQEFIDRLCTLQYIQNVKHLNFAIFNINLQVKMATCCWMIKSRLDMSIWNGPWIAEIKMTRQVLTGYASIFNIPWETLDDGHKDDCLMVTRMDLIMLLVMVSCGHVKHLQSDSAMFIHRENVWATKSSTATRQAKTKSVIYIPLFPLVWRTNRKEKVWGPSIFTRILPILFWKCTCADKMAILLSSHCQLADTCLMAIFNLDDKGYCLHQGQARHLANDQRPVVSCWK